ncbi:MAG: TonB system transport protein ExbD [Gemmobacter sp.]
MAGGFPNGDDDLAEAHEINVTPFIDVMLVLLIVFMVAAPLSTVDIAVTLPSSSASPQERPEDPILLTLTATQEMSVNGEPVADDALGPALDAASKGNPETPVLIRADTALSYGDLMALLDRLRGAGYLEVGLVGQEALP